MPARTSAAQLFDHANAGMAMRLRRVRAPAELMSALRWGEEVKLTMSNSQSPKAACWMDERELEFVYEPA